MDGSGRSDAEEIDSVLRLDARLRCQRCGRYFNCQDKLPRYLRCLHTMCEQCLAGVVLQSPAVPCALYRALTEVPFSNWASLSVVDALVDLIRFLNPSNPGGNLEEMDVVSTLSSVRRHKLVAMELPPNQNEQAKEVSSLSSMNIGSPILSSSSSSSSSTSSSSDEDGTSTRTFVGDHQPRRRQRSSSAKRRPLRRNRKLEGGVGTRKKEPSSAAGDGVSKVN